MKKGVVFLILSIFITSLAIGQEAVPAAPHGFVDYWPYVSTVLLAISELLAFSPFKANGIVAFIILLIKSLAGKK